MAVTYKPIFTQTPKVGTGVLAAANATRDGSGVIVTCYTAGTNGAYIKRVTFISSQAIAAASSAMVGHVFTSIDAGSTWQLRAEVALPTITASTTVIGQSQTITFSDGLVLPAGGLVGCTISVFAGAQDRFIGYVEGGDY
jgi:hypothetical protein